MNKDAGVDTLPPHLANRVAKFAGQVCRQVSAPFLHPSEGFIIGELIQAANPAVLA
jgi:hypothetical protein